MNITFTIKKTDGAAEVHEDTRYLAPGDVLVIMARRNESGELIVGDFEPIEIDNHDDTLRQIGGHIVDFAKR